MGSPMFDLPEHFPIEIDINGNGPADSDEAVATICWCGEKNCEKYKEAQ